MKIERIRREERGLEMRRGNTGEKRKRKGKERT